MTDPSRVLGSEPDEIADLVARAVQGDRGALARLLSLAERGGPRAHEVGRATFEASGAAATVGITGAPGAGKSTLTGALLGEIRRGGERVAVLAIDPSSPFTGGAILGDRIRMDAHVLDDGVFIRSMATRGHLGGLSMAAPQAVRVLAAAGFPWVVVETVGVGQVEVEVAEATDTRVVVVNPGWGDEVQANKAGLLEIADVFVVNKADRDGTAETIRHLASALELAPRQGWTPPIVSTVATTGQGVAELWEAIRGHRDWLVDSGELAVRRRRRHEAELQRIVMARLAERARAAGDDRDDVTAAVAAGDLDPWSAADRLI